MTFAQVLFFISCFITFGIFFYCLFIVFQNMRYTRLIKNRLNDVPEIKSQAAAASTRVQLQLWKKNTDNLNRQKRYLMIGLAVWPIVVPMFFGFTPKIFAFLILYYVLVIVLPVVVHRFKRARYVKAFISELPNTIDYLSRSVRTGQTIISAIHGVAREGEGVVANEFKKISERLEVGRNFSAVLNEAAMRVGIQEFSFFAIVLSVQQEMGANIIDILTELSQVLRSRQVMQLKIKALSAEGITSAIAVGAIPLVICAILSIIQPAYIGTLFTDPLGQWMLLGGLLSQIIGSLVIARMVQIDE